jgi:hypothetical protein
VDFLKSPLFQQWTEDQVLALSASELARSNDLGRSPSIKAARRIAQAQENQGVLSNITLHSIANIPSEKQCAWDELERIDVSDAVTAALTLLQNLQADSCNHIALMAHGAALLRQPGTRFQQFLSWARRASPQIESAPQHPAWSRSVWDQLFECLETANVFDDIDKTLEQFRTPVEELKSGRYKRIEAICAVNGQVLAALTRANRPVPSAWTRLCIALLDSLFCKPLMVARMSGGTIGISLPVIVHLTDPLRSHQAGYAFFEGGAANRYVPPELPNSYCRFENGALRWDLDWRDSFRRALQFAKDLWKSQFSRLNNDYQKEKVAGKCLEVDLSFANHIVTEIYGGDPDSGVYPLVGLSATAYWVQVVLGLLLPDKEIPMGLATGLVEVKGGELTLKYVPEIPAKLAYAAQAGLISRVVLPADSETRQILEECVVDLRTRATLLNFLATPAVRHSFGAMLKRLFDIKEQAREYSLKGANAAAITRVPSAENSDVESDEGKVREISRYEVAELERVRKWLVSDKSGQRIKFVPRRELNEELLGKTLAWIDEGIRDGSKPPSKNSALDTNDVDNFSAPGLGILCVRTREGEEDMRFWANVFRLLDVNPLLWKEFQWADVERASEILSTVLNNFTGDSKIAAAPPPDLFVIVDDGRLTQHDKGRRFPERFDGRLNQLLHQSESQRLLVDKLSSMSHRRDWLFETRIVVIRPDSNRVAASHMVDLPQPASDVEVADTAASAQGNMDFDRLRIFRYGFSIHSAYAVLNHEMRPPLEWNAVREQLQNWSRENGPLRYHRGEYFVPEKKKINILTPRQHDAALHLAAAVSMAPMLAPQHSVSGVGWDKAYEPESYGEAIWHCHRARLSSPSGSPTNILARQYFSSLGFLQSNPHWDTRRLLSFNFRTHAKDAWNLANSLLAEEKAARPDVLPHLSRYADALNALTGSILETHNSGNLFSEAREFVRKEKDRCYQGKYLSNGGISLYSEFAFFMSRLLRCHDSTSHQEMWIDQLREVESALEKSADLLLRKWRSSDPLDYPFCHGWLESKWRNRELLPHKRCNYALIACRTEVRPVPQSWVALLNLLEPKTKFVNAASTLADLWGAAAFDKAELAADIAIRFAGSDRKSRYSALWNLLSWLVIAGKVSSGFDNKRQDLLLDLTKTFLYASDWIHLVYYDKFQSGSVADGIALRFAIELTDGKKKLPSLTSKKLKGVGAKVCQELNARLREGRDSIPADNLRLIEELVARKDLAEGGQEQ